MRRVIACLLVLCVGCGPHEKGELHMISTSYAFTIVPSVSPARARETILYKVVIRDRDSRQPIETGEGQIYANDSTTARTWDGFQKGAELGTYYGKLNFTVTGRWAVAIRFRRDSLHPLEKIEWYQEVYNERQAAVP
jgi:hypothetical protein